MKYYQAIKFIIIIIICIAITNNHVFLYHKIETDLKNKTPTSLKTGVNQFSFSRPPSIDLKKKMGQNQDKLTERERLKTDEMKDYYLISFPSKKQISGSDRSSKSFQPITSISIRKNADFPIYASSGSGSPNNPYIIEGYNITASGTLIKVNGTSAYFIIRNNVLNGNGNLKGIQFENVQYGTIYNNSIYSIKRGVYLSACTNITMSNNEIYNISADTFRVEQSAHITMVNNTVWNVSTKVFDVEQSTYITMVNNTVWNVRGNAFEVEQSTYITMVNNTVWNISSAAVYFSASKNTKLINNVIARSRVGVWFLNTTNITMSNNTAWNIKSNAFDVRGSTYITMTNNTAWNIKSNAFDVRGSTYITMTNN
ncbi:MAG: right-handed parallel beta-helix repeat-containing protein, partial [Candidatus Hodarchaeota archaeon]